MYRAKEHGRNNFQFFTDDLNALMKERFELESNLRRALDRGQFELYYQPRIALASHAIVGCEALIRWLVEDAATAGSKRDFGKDVLPRLVARGEGVFAYRFGSAW